MKFVLFLIPLQLQADLKTCIDKAIQSVPGAVGLVDGVVYSYGVFAILYNENGFIVEGTPLIDPKLVKASTQVFKSNYMVSMPDETGRARVYYLSETDYMKVKEEARNLNLTAAMNLARAAAIN
jgi:hypothetical protein